MFWKLIALTLVVWAVALYFSVTIGGFIHVLPVGALVVVVMRRMAKEPNTEFGRWRSGDQRRKR